MREGEKRRGKGTSQEEESWLRLEKKGQSTRIVKQSQKSKKSAFLKRKILVISETLVAGKSTEYA